MVFQGSRPGVQGVWTWCAGGLGLHRTAFAHRETPDPHLSTRMRMLSSCKSLLTTAFRDLRSTNPEARSSLGELQSRSPSRATIAPQHATAPQPRKPS
jgi:hypothetical protein